MKITTALHEHFSHAAIGHMTWPLLKHCCIVSRVGHRGTGCKTATQPPIPPLKRLFSSRGLLHEVASSMLRRWLMKELGESAECKHQFVKLSWKAAASPWNVQDSIGPYGNWHANVNCMRQCQVCTTDNFVFPLLPVLLLEPVRSVCLSPQAAAGNDNKALSGALPIKVDQLDSRHHAPPAVTAAAGAIAAAVTAKARWASLTGNHSVADDQRYANN
ncbi:hypothetical protein HPB50_028119 [Hyalomma asiaticum]|nr:hypothetical protein HPB50_028119 [Hyalomma asiaticum]